MCVGLELLKCGEGAGVCYSRKYRSDDRRGNDDCSAYAGGEAPGFMSSFTDRSLAKRC